MRVARLQPDTIIETCEPFFDAVELHQRETAIVVRRGHIGPDSYCLAELPFRILISPLLQINHAKEIADIKMPRLDIQNLAIHHFSLSQVPGLVQASGGAEILRQTGPARGIQLLKQLKCPGMVRIGIQDLPAGARGAY